MQSGLRVRARSELVRYKLGFQSTRIEFVGTRSSLEVERPDDSRNPCKMQAKLFAARNLADFGLRIADCQSEGQSGKGKEPLGIKSARTLLDH